MSLPLILVSLIGGLASLLAWNDRRGPHRSFLPPVVSVDHALGYRSAGYRMRTRLADHY